MRSCFWAGTNSSLKGSQTEGTEVEATNSGLGSGSIQGYPSIHPLLQTTVDCSDSLDDGERALLAGEELTSAVRDKEEHLVTGMELPGLCSAVVILLFPSGLGQVFFDCRKNSVDLSLHSMNIL